MKALKLSAVVFTALFALGACKTAPGGGSGGADAILQAGLSDALGKIEGGVAGMTAYGTTVKQEVKDGGDFTSLKSIQVFFDSGFTKFAYAEAALYDGTLNVGSGGVSQMVDLNNEIVAKEATSATLTELTGLDTYKFSLNGAGEFPVTDVSGYKIYTLSDVKAQTWDSSKVGGQDTWEEKSNSSLDQNRAIYVKQEGNKIVFMIVEIKGTVIQFGLDDDPRSPGAQNTYTKK